MSEVFPEGVSLPPKLPAKKGLFLKELNTPTLILPGAETEDTPDS